MNGLLIVFYSIRDILVIMLCRRLEPLVSVACPVDGPSFDATGVWTDLEEALRRQSRKA